MTGGLIPGLLGLGLQDAGLLEGLSGPAMCLLQRGDFVRQRGLAQQVVALGRKQAATVAVGPGSGQRLPAILGIALLVNPFGVGLAQPFVGAMPLSLGIELLACCCRSVRACSALSAWRSSALRASDSAGRSSASFVCRASTCRFAVMARR